MVRNSQVGSFTNIVGHAVREFDLVPYGRFAELKVLGAVGTYANSGRNGSAIVGHFVHWNGQTAAAGPASFGSIDLSSCTADYVFTAPLTGCSWVVTSQGGALRLYHEPTTDAPVTYADPVVLRLGLDYSLSEDVSGNGVVVRRTGGWTAIVSTVKFGDSKASVATQDF